MAHYNLDSLDKKILKLIAKDNGSLKFEITAKRLYAASQRVL
jgi:DNA-binding Lrp family transcriptional regulator